VLAAAAAAPIVVLSIKSIYNQSYISIHTPIYKPINQVLP
jgi:hypothetical protein